MVEADDVANFMGADVAHLKPALGIAGAENTPLVKVVIEYIRLGNCYTPVFILDTPYPCCGEHILGYYFHPAHGVDPICCRSGSPTGVIDVEIIGRC